MGKNNIWMIIIIVLLVIMCAGLAAGFFVTLRQVQEITNANGQQNNYEHAPAISLKDQIFIKYSEPLTCNLLKGPEGTEHVLKLNLTIAINGQEKESAELQQLLIDKEAAVRDIANRIIRNTTFEQMQAADGQDELSKKIFEAITQEFATNLIVGVLFENIIQQ